MSCQWDMLTPTHLLLTALNKYYRSNGWSGVDQRRAGRVWKYHT